MTNRLAGKHVLITAAGQGIGRATAIACAREGALVHATDIDLNLLVDLDCASRARLDVCAPNDIAAVTAALPAIDALFNFAGYVHNGTILDASEEDFDFAIDLNVKGMFRMIRACLPKMLDAGGGAIINMASVVSSVKGAPNRCVYGLTKAAVIGLTKSVAADYVTRGIRCNAICPGTVDTPSLQQRLHATGDYEAARRAFIGRQPMGRLAKAEEIAALAVYLASDEARFTTGQAHIIDGGWAN